MESSIKQWHYAYFPSNFTESSIPGLSNLNAGGGHHFSSLFLFFFWYTSLDVGLHAHACHIMDGLHSHLRSHLFLQCERVYQKMRYNKKSELGITPCSVNVKRVCHLVVIGDNTFILAPTDSHTVCSTFKKIIISSFSYLGFLSSVIFFSHYQPIFVENVH